MRRKTAVTQAFLVPADAPGLTVGPRDKLMGLNALPTYAVTLENVTVPCRKQTGRRAGH